MQKSDKQIKWVKLVKNRLKRLYWRKFHPKRYLKLIGMEALATCHNIMKSELDGKGLCQYLSKYKTTEQDTNYEWRI